MLNHMDVRMALRIEHGANPARGEIVTIRKFSGIPGGRWSDEPAGDGDTVAVENIAALGECDKDQPVRGGRPAGRVDVLDGYDRPDMFAPALRRSHDHRGQCHVASKRGR